MLGNKIFIARPLLLPYFHEQSVCGSSSTALVVFLLCTCHASSICVSLSSVMYVCDSSSHMLDVSTLYGVLVVVVYVTFFSPLQNGHHIIFGDIMFPHLGHCHPCCAITIVIYSSSLRFALAQQTRHIIGSFLNTQFSTVQSILSLSSQLADRKSVV